MMKSYSGESILAQIGNYVEDSAKLHLGRKIEIYLEGGYNNDFSNRVGESKIIGNLIISAGEVTVKRIVIQ